MEKMDNPFAYHKIITDDKDNPVDYEFLEVNKAFEDLIGLKKSEIIGQRASQIIHDIKIGRIRLD